MRLPYEVIAMEADRLIMLMASTSNYHDAYYWFHRYIDFIEACGWTDQDFDRETLKRVNASWCHEFQS